jgi:hypothetical protein
MLTLTLTPFPIRNILFIVGSFLGDFSLLADQEEPRFKFQLFLAHIPLQNN